MDEWIFRLAMSLNDRIRRSAAARDVRWPVRGLGLTAFTILVLVVVSPALTRDVQPLVAQQAPITVQFAPGLEILQLALEAGFENRQTHVSIKTAVSSANPDCVAAVASGRAQYGICDALSFLESDQAQTRVFAVANIFDRNPNAIVTLRDSGITEPKHLEGKKIGVFSAFYAHGDLALFEAANDVKVDYAFSASEASILSDLDNRTFEAVGVFLHRATRFADLNRYTVLEYSDAKVDILSYVLITSESRIAADPTSVRTVVQSVLNALNWSIALENRDEVMALAPQIIRNTTPDAIQRQLDVVSRLLVTDRAKKRGIGHVSPFRMADTWSAYALISPAITRRAEAGHRPAFTNDFASAQPQSAKQAELTDDQINELLFRTTEQVNKLTVSINTIRADIGSLGASIQKGLRQIDVQHSERMDKMDAQHSQRMEALQRLIDDISKRLSQSPVAPKQ